MGITYFKRYRMELDLERFVPSEYRLPEGYEVLPWSEDLVRQHGLAKHEAFQWELDANVFPCLGQRDGCLRLMQEIAGRSNFVPEATWLLRFREPDSRKPQPVGTVQGIQSEGWGALQNLGIAKPHRGLGLGTILLNLATQGFQKIGLTRMHLEVTTDNTAALRLYERLGYRRAKTVFKAADVAMA
ncbi:putative acetyltransferase [Rosistilla oblonga]|uniref:Putative acetyltransferase n=1 Tax=Rosistilla oblonga TaxID=2527990 RepID=A0A518IT05_9BACT|nr:GNAT family N-acetyltransferase [Rosistilla oblonga]QDV12193.1 putative acetyltransferase [Rosistilla oblonga]QDV56193.1 putative acetyltransferase [Rosistilla oblonga]